MIHLFYTSAEDLAMEGKCKIQGYKTNINRWLLLKNSYNSGIYEKDKDLSQTSLTRNTHEFNSLEFDRVDTSRSDSSMVKRQ